MAEMMMDAKSPGPELQGLEFLHRQEWIREAREGEFHNGPGAVVQVPARKPWPGDVGEPGNQAV